MICGHDFVIMKDSFATLQDFILAKYLCYQVCLPVVSPITPEEFLSH